MRKNRKLDKLRKRQVSQEKKIWTGGKKENEGVCGGGRGREEGEGTEYKYGRVSCRVSDKLLRGSIWPIAAWTDYSLQRRINKS
jgi:hypothetical protein